MDDNSLNSRLSRISTIWTMLGNAESQSLRTTTDKNYALIQRYQGAVYRYLLGALRDPDAADEVFQDFALRVVQGAFRRANPERGRFRDYLKTTLSHLVTDYRNRLRRRPALLEKTYDGPDQSPCSVAEDDQRFLQSWREELMARAWQALERVERTGSQPYYTVLRFRSENTAATSAEMAEQLTRQLKPEQPFTDMGIRKILQRAKSRFADLLLDEITQSLEDPTLEELERELIDLELLPYCRSALLRRK